MFNVVPGHIRKQGFDDAISTPMVAQQDQLSTCPRSARFVAITITRFRYQASATVKLMSVVEKRQVGVILTVPWRSSQEHMIQ